MINMKQSCNSIEFGILPDFSQNHKKTILNESTTAQLCPSLRFLHGQSENSKLHTRTHILGKGGEGDIHKLY